MVGFSQFTDDFSDGDFTNNPAWIGDIGNFEVDTVFQLHLNDTITNVASLSTESKAIENGSWEFEVKMDFSPSTSNFSKIYLVSDEQNLSGNLNGYFVKIGGQSGSGDDVSLYVQSGSTETKIIQEYLLSVVGPRPIALASTIDNKGIPNLSPFSFFNLHSS